MSDRSKRLFLVALLLPALLLGLTAVARAQEAEATLTVDKTEATVGDPLALTLAVRHPAGHRLVPPELGEQWGDFTVAGQSPAETADNGDGTATTTLTLDGRLFAPGDYQTPPLTVTLTDGAGGLYEVTAAPARVSIVSVLAEGDTELRDIKPQAQLPYTNLLPWIGLALIAVISVGGAAWMRRNRARPVAVVDNRLPHEIALAELDRVEALRLPEQGRFKEHYTLTTDCVRRYMGRTCDIPVLERTTAEIAADLRSAGVTPDVQRLFVSFLEEGDLVKFANFTPDAASAGQLLAQARLIVEATRPLPGESAGNGPASGNGRLPGGLPADSTAPSADGWNTFSHRAVPSGNGSGPSTEVKA